MWDDNANNGEGACTVSSTPVYNANKLVLQSAFTEESVCNDKGFRYDCDASGLSAGANYGGFVGANAGSWTCDVDSDGFASCGDRGGAE